MSKYLSKKWRKCKRVKNARRKKRKDNIERWKDASFATLHSCNPRDRYLKRNSNLMKGE
jgi:hypothetical protein